MRYRLSASPGVLVALMAMRGSTSVSGFIVGATGPAGGPRSPARTDPPQGAIAKATIAPAFRVHAATISVNSRCTDFSADSGVMEPDGPSLRRNLKQQNFLKRLEGNPSRTTAGRPQGRQ